MAFQLLLRDLKGLRLSVLVVIFFAALSTSYIVVSYSKTLIPHRQIYHHVGERDHRNFANLHEINGNEIYDYTKHNEPSLTILTQSSNVHNVSHLVVTTTAKTQQPAFSLDTTTGIQQRRQRHIERICQRTLHIQAVDFGSKKPVVDQTFNYLLHLSYVNDDYKIIVTTIHKVGSSNWRRFMQDLHVISSEKFRKKWPSPLKFLSKRPNVEIQNNLKDYTKVLFVRHPLVRLLSAYRDKFVKLPTSAYIKAAVKIIKRVRKKSPANLKKPDMTFTEFLTYLADSKSETFDSHWALVFRKYKPCHVRYDVIGKLETLLADVDYLTEKLGVKGRVEYRYPKPYSGSSNTSLLIESYSKVPPELVKNVCQIYHDDFIAFDYPLPKDFSNMAGYLTKID